MKRLCYQVDRDPNEYNIRCWYHITEPFEGPIGCASRGTTLGQPPTNRQPNPAWINAPYYVEHVNLITGERTVITEAPETISQRITRESNERLKAGIERINAEHEANIRQIRERTEKEIRAIQAHCEACISHTVPTRKTVDIDPAQ